MARRYEVENGVQLVPLGVYTRDVDYTNFTVQVRLGGSVKARGCDAYGLVVVDLRQDNRSCEVVG